MSDTEVLDPMAQLHEDWSKLLSTTTGNAWSPLISNDARHSLDLVYLVPEPEDLLGREEIEARIVSAPESRDAWFRCESWAGWGTPPPYAGLPLDGEWIVDGNSSARLFHLGGEHWRIITLTEREEVEDNHAAFLKEKVSMQGKDGLIFDYAVYWSLSEAGAVVRRASRLLAIRQGKAS